MHNAMINLEHNRVLNMWENDKQLLEVRKIVCDKPLSDMEFGLLVQLGKGTGLNPFLKEIWAIKYSPSTPAQIFIGRDGYRKAAQRQPDYEYHQVNAVYSKDEFRITNDEILHNYGFSNRGELIGAYCIVKRKSSCRPTYVMVSMTEYHQNQGVWKSKPETMIKKVAEAQALRQSFQEALAGTYLEEELPLKPHMNNVRQLTPLNSEGNTQTERLKNLLSTTPNTYEHNELSQLIASVGLSEERLNKALAHYNVSSLDDLSGEQRQDFTNNLKKISTTQTINNNKDHND